MFLRCFGQHGVGASTRGLPCGIADGCTAEWGDASVNSRPAMPHHRPTALMALQSFALVSPSRVRLLLAGWVCLVALLCLAWMHAAAPTALPRALAVAVMALAVGLVWRMPLWPQGTCLHWTGSQWCLGPAPLALEQRQELGPLTVLMDGQSWILLQAQGLPSRCPSQWLLVARAANPERWPDIRRVLYSSLAAEPQNINQV